MITKLEHLWEMIRSSYWLVPGLLSLSAVALAYVLLAVDIYVDVQQYRGFGWLVFATVDGARVVLSTIATSTFAAATLTFSITMLTLSLTSSQFGPRLLRNFLRDPVNQFIFGAFIATFIYCLLILRGMAVESKNIPNISVSLSMLMVLADAALFIWFIHHVTSSIRVEHITAEIGQEFINCINRFFPEPHSQIENATAADQTVTQRIKSGIRAPHHGYIQAINYQTLKTFAEKENITIKFLFKPGHFVLPGAVLAEIWTDDTSVDNLEAQILPHFMLGVVPTAEQDLEFTIRQLVQVAARALSPGINDPFTAMTCIDYLCTGLALLATRNLPQTYVRSDDGKLLLIKNTVTFNGVCNACFCIIRQMCANNLPVLIYLLDMMAQIAMVLQRIDDCDAILNEARLAVTAATQFCETEHDRAVVEQRLEGLKTIICEREKLLTSLGV